VPPAAFAVFSGNLLPSAPADFLTDLATVPHELPSLISLVRFPGRGFSSADVSTGVLVASAPIDSKNSNVPSAVGVIKLFYLPALTRRPNKLVRSSLGRIFSCVQPFYE
jgi:hypothetical protein